MSLESDLAELADQVAEFDPAGAERLKELRRSVRADAPSRSWAGADVLRSINPALIVDNIRNKPIESSRLAWFERARNLFVLVPVLITWLGLFAASLGYRAAVDVDPSLRDQPFLLLWEAGFYGHGPALSHYLTLSFVAAIDVAVIFIILLLTWLVHGELNVKQARREVRARTLEAQLHQAAWRASLELADKATEEKRFKEVLTLGEQLLAELAAERQRIEELTKKRERTTDHLDKFAEKFQPSASAMSRLADSLEQTLAHLSQTTDALLQRTETLATQHSELETSLAGVKSAVSNLETSLAGVKSAVSNADQNQRQVATQLKEATTTATASLEQTSAQMREFASSLKTNLTSLNTIVEDLLSNMQVAAKAQTDAAAEIRAAGSGIRQAKTAFGDAANTLQSAANMTSQLIDQNKALQGAVAQLLDELRHPPTTQRRPPPNGGGSFPWVDKFVRRGPRSPNVS